MFVTKKIIHSFLKKVTSILLVCLLMYNMLGYYIGFVFSQMDAKEAMAMSIENGKVDNDDLVLIKVPIPLYHQIDRADYEKVEGEFEYKGKYYNKVKQKVKDDTLYVYCVNNEKKEKLYADLSEHTKTHVIDLSNGKAGKTEKLVKNLIKEYLPHLNYQIEASTPLIVENAQFPVVYYRLIIHDSQVSTPPPQQA